MRPAFIIAGVGALIAYALARTDTGQAIAADAAEFVVNALTPVGLRTNNPGNIDWIEDPAHRWRGMYQINGRHAGFDTPANGVRAIGGELRASIGRGQSLEQAIFEWAPPSENDSEAYAENVSEWTQIPRNVRVTLAMLVPITAGIVRQENGQQPFDLAAIAAWVNS